MAHLWRRAERRERVLGETGWKGKKEGLAWGVEGGGLGGECWSGRDGGREVGEAYTSGGGKGAINIEEADCVFHGPLGQEGVDAGGFSHYGGL